MTSKKNKYTDDEKKIIGERINKIRLEMGMTLEEFGKLFSATKSNVSKWCRGDTLPNPERMKQIAKVGDMTVSELMDTNTQIVTIDETFDDDSISKIILNTFPGEDINMQAYNDLINTLNDIGDLILPVVEIIQIYQTNCGDTPLKIKDKKTLIQSYERYLEAVEMFKSVSETPEILNFIEARKRTVKKILKYLKSNNNHVTP